MYGPDGHDVTTIDAPFDWNPATPLSSLKIGYLKSEFERTGGFGQQANPETIAARKKIFDDVFEALKKAGAKVEEAELPQMNAQPLTVILNAEAAAAFDDITRDGRVAQLSGQANQDWPNSFRTSRVIPAVEYIRATRERTILQQNFHAFMEKWDVLIVPTGTQTLQITNLTGHPQVAVPCGFLNGNNPQSIIFTGRLYEEGTALRVAHAFEQATEWHKMHPKVDWA
jgi:Asp-tRNA(Asn)/Glu-tRNA(Gln) amidotransferase A subunit family amidase